MSAPVRQLRRSRDKAMIAGVCAGMADFFGLDPTLVRLLYLVGSIVSVAFPGLLVYIVLWIVIPKEGY